MVKDDSEEEKDVDENLSLEMEVGKVESQVGRIASEAYGELETEVTKFLTSVDQLAAVPSPPPSSWKQPQPTGAAASSTSYSNDSTSRDLTLTILALRSFAATQSRELWTITTQVVERTVQVIRNALPRIVDGIERCHELRHRKQKESHRIGLDAARLACQKQFEGRMAQERQSWDVKLDKAQKNSRGEIGAMQMRAESAETLRRVLSSRLDVAETNIERLEMELSRTRAELEKTKAEREKTVCELNEKVANANEQEQKAQHDLCDCKSKLRNMEARYEAKVHKLSNTKEELRETKQELRVRTKDLSLLRMKHREKEDECRNAQKRRNDLEASLQFVGRPSPTKTAAATKVAT